MLSLWRCRQVAGQLQARGKLLVVRQAGQQSQVIFRLMALWSVWLTDECAVMYHMSTMLAQPPCCVLQTAHPC